MRLIASIAVGWPAETSAIKKRDLTDVLHWETFSKKYP
jgi:hypothetical protein